MSGRLPIRRQLPFALAAGFAATTLYSARWMYYVRRREQADDITLVVARRKSGG